MNGRAALLAVLVLTGPARAQTAPQAPEPVARQRQKCDHYTRAWTEALARRGRTGLSDDFLQRNAAFIASGCVAPADVCPRSPQELALANDLVIATMNAGMASTFAPFACRTSR